jgi:hypothetical protein
LAEIEEKLRTDASLENIPSETNSFVENTNKFFTNKKLLLNKGIVESPFEIVYDDGYKSNQLTTLSSGERQIVSIIYAVSQVAE